MFCVIYEFTVSIENAGQFQSAWHELSLYLKNNCDSLGARLHKVIEDETKWIVYAQWPSQTVYEKDTPDANLNKLRQAFIPTITNIQILYQMTVEDDLLDATPLSHFDGKKH